MPVRLAQQEVENFQTSQVLETCEVSGTEIFLAGAHFTVGIGLIKSSLRDINEIQLSRGGEYPHS